MSVKIRNWVGVCAFLSWIILTAGPVWANWLETFDGNTLDLPTWQFHCYPDLTRTFSGTILDGDDDNDYLLLNETSSSAIDRFPLLNPSSIRRRMLALFSSTDILPPSFLRGAFATFAFQI